ncbi:MAG: FAD-dependent oxidoreductase [Candidatus Babeliales bacterium]|nr:FAD-dependent oxidoreductase [Candidatus Babeliales bacterium]
MLCRKSFLLFCSLSFFVVAQPQDAASLDDVAEIVINKLAQNAQADWLIVGAGPAGIITIGVLMDVGVDPKRITWLDPEFNVGRMGKYYSHIESNNKARDFIAFINACNTFGQCTCPALEELKKMDPQKPCLLESIVAPLQGISDYLRTQVVTVQDSLEKLYFNNGLWYVRMKQHGTYCAQHIVLATGSQPRTVEVNSDQNVIPLDYALDPATLQSLVDPQDKIGVVGGAHSAILLLKYLSGMNVKHIYNFYRHPITYAIDQGCWALDPLGVKGTTGQWAKDVLEKNPPVNITRVHVANNEQLQPMIEQARCSKVIYATGYERSPLPAINDTTPITDYDGKTGIIAPRLFGIGLAFPEFKTDDGYPRHIVGLNCFMDYALRLVPQWVSDKDLGDQITRCRRAKEQIKILSAWEKLFTISVL